VDATLGQLFVDRILGKAENVSKICWESWPEMSPQDCGNRAEACDRLADSVESNDRIHEIMREAASQWRRLADDSEAHERRVPQLSWARAAL
jgi:hypothetical protein